MSAAYAETSAAAANPATGGIVTGLDYESYPALKDVYKDYFLIGTTSSNFRMGGDKLDIVKYHFSAFTPENEMKPDSTERTKGYFTYEQLDQQLAKVQGLKLIGHTLAWHSQTPSWMWGSPKALPAKDAKANLEAHIAGVLGRYGDKLYSVDVINEAFADGANNPDWRQDLRRNEGWYTALGPEWVEDAFLKAAEVIDAKGWKCKLYYNDYNLDNADKAKAVYGMVKDLNEKYANKRPGGKPLIEGIGMQGHYNENTSVANVESSIKLFSSLPGVSISVTELDIGYMNSGSLTSRQQRDQAIKYAQLFDLYKKNAAGAANGKKGRIERVTFWGTNDADSWRGSSFPLLFDKDLRAKEAFKAILDTDKYLSAVIPPAGKTYEAYPALKDAYKDYFTLGIFGSGEINALVYNFAAFAPGNEMKPDYTQGQKGTFTYGAADAKFNDLAQRNPKMIFYGHTLAWHSQSPTWLWDASPARFGQPGTFDKDIALANLNNHIANVLGYYGGRLQGVDVVNEAVGIANPNDWKASLAKGEGWYMALGWRWVELAYLQAAKVVDAHPNWNCKLIYNDFGLDSPAKAKVVYEMVKDINARYAGSRPNGKQLIEVIGMQEHDSLATKAADVEASIKLFATLPGVKVNITEMDIGCPADAALSAANENDQAMKYAELFQVFMKYAAGPANKSDNPKVIDRVSICGVRDTQYGWRAGEHALLFTSEGLAKQALIAVLDPDEFLATHKYAARAAADIPRPVDGVYVFDLGRGDAWSGANIILGNDATKWPWSEAGEDGVVAFTPEKDATYRITINYTAKGTTAIRLRWIKDNANGSYTKADGAAVNSFQYSASAVATTIPAYFNSGMVNAGSYTLVTEIKLDGSQAADGLIGNIAVRGGMGGNAYTINSIKIEKLGAAGAANKVLVNWPVK
jgi:endo-1,4-beta-xylanase